MKDKKIGFIGQGWIGKHYADNFEERGYKVIRYGLEEPYVKNKIKIKECDIVFIAVPTPTTPKGFDDKIVRDSISLIADGAIAVIKSTIIPGTTESIQAEYPNKYIFHSPEFLREVSAAYDAANPERNIVGIPKDSEDYMQKAKEVLKILPQAPFEKICQAREAEIIKYAGNVYLYIKVVYANMLHDIAEKLECDWDTIRDSVIADSRIGKTHFDPIHDSGRGAGGDCFIKDFAALAEEYKKHVGDKFGLGVFEAIKNKNVDLLTSSGKNIDFLRKVYGDDEIN